MYATISQICTKNLIVCIRNVKKEKYVSQNCQIYAYAMNS